MVGAYNFTLAMEYAKALNAVLDSVIQRKCYGCQFSRPSQLDHDVCLIEDVVEQVDICLETCLERICEDELLRNFEQHLTDDDLLRCPLKYYSRAWRAALWKDEDWKQTVIDYIVQIRNAQTLVHELTEPFS